MDVGPLEVPKKYLVGGGFETSKGLRDVERAVREGSKEGGREEKGEERDCDNNIFLFRWE